jgi:hypothetical protein
MGHHFKEHGVIFEAFGFLGCADIQTSPRGKFEQLDKYSSAIPCQSSFLICEVGPKKNKGMGQNP